HLFQRLARLLHRLGLFRLFLALRIALVGVLAAVRVVLGLLVLRCLPCLLHPLLLRRRDLALHLVEGTLELLLRLLQGFGRHSSGETLLRLLHLARQLLHRDERLLLSLVELLLIGGLRRVLRQFFYLDALLFDLGHLLALLLRPERGQGGEIEQQEQRQRRDEAD